MATPTIQDVFEMRKNGHFEQAYSAALKLYENHHGHYTTLCMFWTATDVCRLRINAGKIVEAENILQNLISLYPCLQDKDNSAARTLIRLAAMLVRKDAKNELSFQMEQFMSEFGWVHLNSIEDFIEEVREDEDAIVRQPSLSEKASLAIYIQRMKQLGKYGK